MADCEKIAGCMFFNDKLTNMPAVVDTIRKSFCHGDYTRCARYMVTEIFGIESIPSDIFPGNSVRAKTILALNGM